MRIILKGAGAKTRAGLEGRNEQRETPARADLPLRFLWDACNSRKSVLYWREENKQKPKYMRYWKRKTYRQTLNEKRANAIYWAVVIVGFVVVYFSMVEKSLGNMQLF